MRYGSVCSGIEAASVAWEPLGWTAAFFAETEKFPSAVLSHRFPNVPNHGDFTTINGDEYGTVDLLVGGTPCQDFSVAGLRAGLAGKRGQLTIEFARLAGRLCPRWLVWENVPGVLSADGGRAFGIFLGTLAELGYGFAYRVLDAQHFGVPQRRRRVFVVGYRGDWRPPAAVLFERESLCRHPAPRETAAIVAGAITASGVGTCGADDNAARARHLIMPTLNGNIGTCGYNDFELNGGLVAFNSREDPVSSESVFGALGSSHPQAQAIAGGGRDIRRITPLECERMQGLPDEWTRIPNWSSWRRMTPSESPDQCRRIGMEVRPSKSGGWLVKDADRPRYKAIGNAMAVPVMRWIGERIDGVERILKRTRGDDCVRFDFRKVMESVDKLGV